MNTSRRLAIATIILATTVPGSAISQQPKQETAPKTKLEAFTGAVGTVSIKGYVEAGTMKSTGTGTGTGTVRVIAVTVRDAKGGQATSGAIFEITETKSYGTDTSRSYVDAEELGGLLSGLTYISQIDSSATPMRYFEAQYSTRGGLILTVFNDALNQRRFSVHVGGAFGGKDAYFGIHDLPNFWDLIAKAKNIIENPERLGKMTSSPSSKEE